MSANAMWRAVLASLVAGCSFHSTPATGGSGDDAAVTVDAAVPLDAAVTDDGCLRDDLVTVCLPDQAQPLILAAGAIDTDTSALCIQGLTGPAAGYCVLAGTTIMLPAGVTLTAHGAKPLVLASPGAITIAGIIDIAGHLSGAPQAAGPGVSACTPGTLPMDSGGGYGGSFGSGGGAGGADSGAKPGGVPPTFAAPTTFRGGCSGQVGGNAAGGASGVGGGGGGAIAILSKLSIQIDGTINASGGGGGGESPSDRGGGGGGAGGTIVIDAPAVTGTTPKIYANGGSGGEAAGGNAGHPGNDAPADPTMAAAGGVGGSSGGDGGNGAIGGIAAGLGGTGTSAAGGGGGGGGVGVIRRFGTATLPGTVSPPAS